MVTVIVIGTVLVIVKAVEVERKVKGLIVIVILTGTVLMIVKAVKMEKYR